MNLLPPTTQVRLEHQLDALFLFTKGLPVARLQQAGPDGKWSILQNMMHLARYQEVFIQRLDRIMLEELPGLPAYRAEADPAWMIWQQADQHLVVAHLKEKRIDLVNLIKTYSPKQLKRMGYHSRFGGMDVIQWTEYFLLHEAHHLYTILRLRQVG